MNRSRLTFQLTRRDLYEIVRITAAQRAFRRVAMPALALFVFLGHAVDGNYGKGALWGLTAAIFYWGISQIMFLIHVYGAGNETLLAPQVMELSENQMVVRSEHGTDTFDRPSAEETRISDGHVVVRMGSNTLVFLKRSFAAPGDFQVLKDWLTSGTSGHADAETR